MNQQINENRLNLENKENFNSSFGLKVAVCVVDQKQEEIICLRNENAKLSSKIHTLEKNARIQNLRKEKEQLELKHSCEEKEIILEKFKQDSQALSQEKQILARELEEFKTKFYQSEKFAKKMTYQIDTSTITIQKLETELQALHKDKRQYNEILSSIQKNHEKELDGLQEKIDKLDIVTKDHERKQKEKSDVIGDLLDRLDLEVTAKRRMADCINETSPQISPKISPKISPQISPGSQKEEQYVLNMMANHEEILNLKTLLKEKENEKLRMAKKCLKLKDENNRFCKQIENLSDGQIKTDQLGQKELCKSPTSRWFHKDCDMKINDLNKKLEELKSLLSQDEITKVKEGEKDKIVKKLQNDKKLLAEKLQNSKIVIAKLARTPKTPTGLVWLHKSCEMKIADLKALLEASNTKHSNFKNKAQQYKQQKEAKTEKYKERMRKMEEEFQVKNFIEPSMICFSSEIIALYSYRNNGILSYYLQGDSGKYSFN